MIDYEQLSNALVEADGDSASDPVSARLGNPALDDDQDRIKVPLTETDQPGMVYVFNVIGENDGVTQALNSGPGLLSERDLIYGRYILLKKRGTGYVIHGVDYQRDAEYVHNVPLPTPGSIKLGQLDWGLLQPTQPRSMRALVSAAVYDGNLLVKTQETIDFTSDIPGSVGEAVAVLVMIDPTTSVISYDVGVTPFDAVLSHIDAFADFYPLNTDPALRTVGWLKLINGMTAIAEGKHIFAAQQILGGSGGGGASPSVVAEGAAQTVNNTGGIIDYEWDSPDTDTGGFWDGGAPTLLTCEDNAVYMATASVHLEWAVAPTGGTVLVRIIDSFSALGWVADWKQEIGTQDSVWLTLTGGRNMTAAETLVLSIENNTDEDLDCYSRITVHKV